MNGGNAEWFTPSRRRRLFADGVAVGFVLGGIIGAAIALFLSSI